MVMQKSASRQKPSSIQPGMHSQADSLPLFQPPFEPGKRTSTTILSKTSPRQWCFHILPLGTNSSHLQSLRPCMACPSVRRSQIKSQQLGSCQRSLHCVNSSRQRACRLLAACLRGPHHYYPTLCSKGAWDRGSDLADVKTKSDVKNDTDHSSSCVISDRAARRHNYVQLTVSKFICMMLLQPMQEFHPNQSHNPWYLLRKSSCLRAKQGSSFLCCLSANAA